MRYVRPATFQAMTNFMCLVRRQSSGSIEGRTHPCSLLRLVWPGRALGVAEVCAVQLLLWGDSGRRFAAGHGIASHRLLESRRREDERQGDRFGADILAADPG